ncbi:MAG: cation diffusion facilitator family transporter [Gammaproteobacteria bacterium]|nr:cation diffusion facilitator family transporter [Gammaproteobacteria bacterium]MDD9863008.1 cation diffusion facilitator family transporter [Gammaproteobacteria bacterium]
MKQPGTDAGSADAGHRLARWATYASVSVALLLLIVKFAAWRLTDSISLLASLIDSALDSTASLITLFAVRHALTPPDSEHRFGHGKAEPLAALGQSAFICGSAVFLLFEALGRLLNPVPPAYGKTGIAIMLFSIAVTAALVCFQNYAARRSGSLAVQADALHYKSDLLTGGAVILALSLSSRPQWALADPVTGLAIAGYILHTAWRIGRVAWDMLMDRELLESQRQEIVGAVFADSKIRAMHDLRTRASGPHIFIQFHIELDGSLSLREAHDVAEKAEGRLRSLFPHAQVIIHQDPYLEEIHTPDRIRPPPPKRQD